MADISALSGLKILIVGLAREGLALADFLSHHDLPFSVTDIRTEDALGVDVGRLRDAGVSLVLGEHPSSLLDDTDILFVSPGVPLETPFLQQARQRRIPLCTESKLFCCLCPALIVGITGSSGKTTTTTLVGKMLEAGGRKVWVGGNIGRPLISVVDQIKATDVVAMELSSFQLEYFHRRLNRNVDAFSTPSVNPRALEKLLGNWSPPVAAILNITPNHLDRHPSMKHYVQAKRALIDYQNKSGAVILNLDNDMTRAIGYQFKSKVRWFSLEAQMPDGAGIVGNQLYLFDEKMNAQMIAKTDDVRLRGTHNLSNILAACLLAREAGALPEAMKEVITSFTGVEHRLELVSEHNGTFYYNDSISTSPERLIAALHSFTEPIILLAGGRDKHLPWDEAAWLILNKTRDVILFGEAAQIIKDALDAARDQICTTHPTVHQRASLEEAVMLAANLAEPADIVLLSPGCASYDAFKDFAARGRRFRELVKQL